MRRTVSVDGACGEAEVLVAGAEALAAGDFRQPNNNPTEEIIAKTLIVFREIIDAILSAREEPAAQIELNIILWRHRWRRPRRLSRQKLFEPGFRLAAKFPRFGPPGEPQRSRVQRLIP